MHTTLDMFYANARDPYSSSAQPALDKADHNLVYLPSTYKPIIQRQPVTKRTVRRWSQEPEDTLRGCFEATDWDALCEKCGDDINAMTECVTDYIKWKSLVFWKSRLESTRRCTGESWRTSSSRCTRCMVRDDEDQRLQGERGSDRWTSGQSKWTELFLQ